ncbi:MAG: tRNA lysidine(34) synthetase TilS [Planctomycetes bacterium]|nr:tRNA lysidine(34) synthetase TilS [Planctomycetota bacterium]
MIRALAHTLLSEAALEPSQSVVVGVSGGADSMALLHLLLGLNRVAGWHLRLHVAHLHHGLRGADADADAAFVQAAADALGVGCTVESRNVADLAQSKSAGVEETGRDERFLFFERVCLQAGANIVAVGHHADDNAETILHRILRGTGLRGLAGMRRSRPLGPASPVRLVRPLLHLPRKTLRDYLAGSGITFREDLSNSAREPTRNRIRHVLLPLIEEQINAQAGEALTRLGLQARWLDDFLRDLVCRTFDTLLISQDAGAVVLNADALARKSRIVQTELVRMAYGRFGLGEQTLSFGHLVAAVELLDDPASGRQVHLPGGLAVEKRYHQLVFFLPEAEGTPAEVVETPVHLPGITRLPGERGELVCTVRTLTAEEVAQVPRAATLTRVFLDYDVLRLPLTLRGRRAGDRFVPLGAPGTKSVSDFLIDTKVGPATRQELTLLCDQAGIVWLIGQRIDERAKLTANTRRVLEVSARLTE